MKITFKSFELSVLLSPDRLDITLMGFTRLFLLPIPLPKNTERRPLKYGLRYANGYFAVFFGMWKRAFRVPLTKHKPAFGALEKEELV